MLIVLKIYVVTLQIKPKNEEKKNRKDLLTYYFYISVSIYLNFLKINAKPILLFGIYDIILSF